MKLIDRAKMLYRASNRQMYGSRDLTYDHAQTFMAEAVQEEIDRLTARITRLESALFALKNKDNAA